MTRLLLTIAILALTANAVIARTNDPDALALVRELRSANADRSQTTYTFRDYQKLRVWPGNRSSETDTTLLAIVEQYFADSVELGHLHQDELVRRETAELPVQLGRVAYFHPVDLFQDRISLPDYTVTGPLGEYGEMDYDFTREPTAGEEIAITFHHHGIVFPGFEGTLWIDSSTHHLTRATFRANQAINLGILTDLDWTEDYQYQNGRTLLVRSVLELNARAEIALLPKYRVLLENSLTNYRFAGQTTTVLALAKRGEAALFPFRPQALTKEEYLAYERSPILRENDWTRSTEVSLLSGPLFNPNVVQYNRVEGLRLELRERLPEIGMWPLGIDATGAYGFGDKRWAYDLTASQGIFWHDVKTVSTTIATSGGFHTTVRTVPVPWLSVGGRLYDDRELHGTARSILMNTISAVGYKSDYPDYYWHHGGGIFATYQPYALADLTLLYTDERQSSITDITADFSVLKGSTPFRPNPPINDGLLRELRATLNFNSLPEGFAQGRQFYSRVELARAMPQWGSDFNYMLARLHIAFDLPVQQWGMSTVYLDASTRLAGALGNQQLFLFETPRGFSNRTRAFLTIRDRQYQGDRIAMLYLEQNMFDLPARLLHLNFLLPYDIHWFAFANAGYSWLSNETASQLRVPVQTTGNIPYAEAGVGIGNIFNLLRFDFAWRLTHRSEAIGSPFAFLTTIALTL